MDNQYLEEINIEDIRKQFNEQSFLGKFIIQDIDDKTQIIPYVCIVYNNKYPGFYFESIFNHFIRQSNKVKSSLWLSYNDQPIQWHLPFFVQIDKINEEVEIIVHFKKRPENVLPISENIQIDIKNRYFWNLKQACMIRYGHKWEKQIFQTITIEQQYKMFQSYSDHNYKPQFYEFFDKIWDLTNLKKEQQISIPIRIFIDGNMIQRSHVLKDVKETIQNILLPIFEDTLNYNELNINVLGLVVNIDFPVRLLVSTFVNPDGFCYIIIK
ncbi:unnamed protein product [Paramecium primaurelia]|uniref:Autophagy protein 5 n=1 Tax=Paramecium primaurelia TaxID=5886 RepID=A0A8S1Q2C3_PARPR|nr:unnamed protein product [Paramecium primaurelia]